MIKKLQKFYMVSTGSHFKLYSKAFNHAETIPKKYTGDGEDVNPPLKWENPPDNTKSFALIVEDPDAPHGTFTHWLVKDIDKNTTEIKENSVPGTEVTNSWKVKQWKGPKPPSGTHRYFFKLYALNTDKMKATTLNDFYQQVQDYKIDEATYMGKYSAKH
jgi:Raf kinase inhibitor-like YbhB/YbcL family protein